MSIVTELKYTANLDKGVCMTPITPSFMGGDKEAHRFVIDCYRQNSREPVDLSGAGVTAYFVRADGTTIPLAGETNGSKASVLLPAACYAVMGRFSLVIKLSMDDGTADSISTVFWGEGAVSRSRTDVVIDPDSVIPSLEELLAQIAAMEIATNNANAAAENANQAAADALKNVDEAVARQDETISQLSEDMDDVKDVLSESVWVGFEWIENEYIEVNKGTEEAYTGWHRTDYIDISKDKNPLLFRNATSGTGRYNAFYNAEKTFIGYFTLNADNLTVTKPDDAAYMRLSCESRANPELQRIHMSIDGIKNRLGLSQIEEGISRIETEFDEAFEEITGKNILPPASINGYLDVTDGETIISGNTYRCAVEKIPLTGSKLYLRLNPAATLNESKSVFVMCYDANGEYLTYASAKFENVDAVYERSVIAGTAYIRPWTNNKLELVDVCISTEPISDFEKYALKTVVKQETINKEPIIAESKPFFGKTIVNFGDSIFGNKRPPNDVSTALANITGATVYNCGFGGCRMAAHNENWDAFSMYRLAYAIANNDFSVQDAVDVSGVSGMPTYFEQTRALLKSIDWNDVDIITIAYGTNDWAAGVEVDDQENALSTATFCGALRYSLETLLTAYPHIKIFVCGQAYRFWMDDAGNFTEDSDTKVISDEKLTDFVAATETVSKAYHVPFIDNYYPLGINEWNRGHYFPSNDGTHHNVLGAKLLAEHIAHEMF